MRIAIVSDNLVCRTALRQLLNSWNMSAVATELGFGAGLAEQLRSTCTEVAIVDLNVEFDLKLLPKIRDVAPRCRLLLMARTLAPELFFHLHEGGYSVLSVKSNIDTFFEYLGDTLAGKARMDPTVMPPGYQEAGIPLGPRQAQLIGLLVQGLKNKEIATELHITEGTVKVYLSRLFEKLHVKDRFELALFGLRSMSMLGQSTQTPANGVARQAELRKPAASLGANWSDPGLGRMRSPVRGRQGAAR